MTSETVKELCLFIYGKGLYDALENEMQLTEDEIMEYYQDFLDKRYQAAKLKLTQEAFKDES